MMSNEDNKAPQDGQETPQPEANTPEDDNIVNIEGMNGDESLDLNPNVLIDSLQKDLLEAKDRTMRALADAENTRRCAQKVREEAGKFAISSSFARDLLDFSDNFKRVL